MSEITVYLPKLGESIVSATVVQWFKKQGEEIQLDEPLMEVSTDKVNSEIPSPVKGTLVKMLADVDQEVKVGEPLALISTDAVVEQKETLEIKKDQGPNQASINKGFLSPAILRIASENGISLSDLENIPKENPQGRLTKKDLQNYLSSKEDSDPSCEAIKMTQMRKMIADNMVKSFYQAPHASLIHEIDVTKILDYIRENKDAFMKKHGAKLTITVFIAHAIAKAVEKFPLINSSLKEDTILVKKNVNLGIAVSVDQGIMVPVIQDSQKLDIPSLCKKIADLAKKVRSNAITAQETKGGTITMTNFGMTGILVGIPIIRFPEVAIIGIGGIKKRAVVLEDDTLVPRSMLHLSLTFDHRVLDGIYGCEFLQELQKQIEGFSSREGF